MLMFMWLLFLNGLLDYGPKITQTSLAIAYIDIEGSLVHSNCIILSLIQ